jgi:hypothetical protein
MEASSYILGYLLEPPIKKNNEDLRNFLEIWQMRAKVQRNTLMG